jgi:hypothetical protein
MLGTLYDITRKIKFRQFERRNMKKMLMLAALTLSAVAVAQAAPTPATKLESFQAQSGILTLRETLGTRAFSASLGGGEVTVEAVRLSQPGNNQTALGVVFSLLKERGSEVVFVDYEELQGLIDALGYIYTKSPSLNPALSPELTFTSKARLKVGFLVSAQQKPIGLVQSGINTVFIAPMDIAFMHDVLVDFKSRLK